MTAKVGEVGRRIYFSATFDMSANTSLSAKIDRPDGSSLTVVPILGTAPLGSYLANEYAYYDTISTDLNGAGTYTACMTYNDATPKVYISDSDTFLVVAPC
jgi:hypothetical protein